MDRFFEKRRRRAERDPEWRAIEDRRRQPDTPVSIFLSEEHGLGWPEVDTQTRIERSLTPDPAWLPLARRVSDWKLRSLANSISRSHQRAGAQWSRQQPWSTFGWKLSGRVADMLDALADEAHGWPDHYYETMDEWFAALHENAAALRAYANADDADKDAAGEWLAAAADPARHDEADAMRAAIHEREAKTLEDAKQAFRWVADHLDGLWD